MAVYEQELTREQQMIIRIFEILEPLMNSPLNRKVMTFLFRNLKLGKVTRFLGDLDLMMIGG